MRAKEDCQIIAVNVVRILEIYSLKKPDDDDGSFGSISSLLYLLPQSGQLMASLSLIGD